MKGGNRLDQLVQRAQQQAPEIDLKDVHQAVITAGSAIPAEKSIFSTLKIVLLMTSIMLAITAVIALWPSSAQPEPAQEPLANIEIAEPITSGPIVADKAEYQAMTSEAAISTQKVSGFTDVAGTPKTPHARRAEYYYEDYEHKPVLQNLEIQEDAESLPTVEPNEILEDEYFELSEEEWKSLHVSITRRVFEYTYQGTSETHKHKARVTANLQSTSTVSSGCAHEQACYDAFIPLGLSKLDGTRFTNVRFQADGLADSLRKMGQVIVFKTSMRSKALVWYPMNEALYEALPQRVQKVCDTKVLQYSGFEVKPSSFLVGRLMEAQGIDSSLISTEIAYDETMAVFATEGQMEDLGFLMSDSTLEIRGRVKRGSISFKSERLENFFVFTNFDNKRGVPIRRKRLAYVPIFISKSRANGYMTSFIDHDKACKKNFHQLFLNSRHGYLPVVYQPVYSDSSIVFWYEPSTELLQVLGLSHEEQAERIQALLEHSNEMELRPTEQYEALELHHMEEEGATTHQTKLLQLDPLTLAKLKIFVEENKVTHISNMGKSVFSKEGMYQELKMGKGPDSTKKVVKVKIPGSGNLRYTEKEASGISPKYITDDLAMNWKTAVTPIGMEGELQIPYSQMDSFIAHNLRTTYLIPLLVRSGQKYTKLDGVMKKQRPDCIFWFEPNDTFLSLLPDTLAASIRSELKYAVQKEKMPPLPFKVTLDTGNEEEKEAPSCQFFDACETRKLAIIDHAIYPNPTRERLHVTITSAVPCTGSISIVDIQGKVIAQSEITLREKMTTHYNFSLGSLEDGIYLVSIETSSGDYIIQRVVKIE